MKHIIILCAFLLACNAELFAQAKPYNVVFDITTGDTAVHQRVIRWVNSISKDYPDAKLEVVFMANHYPWLKRENLLLPWMFKNWQPVIK